MPTALNIAHRIAVLNATTAIFNAGNVQVRTGSPPGPDAAAGGTLLVQPTLQNPAFAGASESAGAVTAAIAGTPGATASATGVPGHFRTRNSAATQIREGTAAASGADMNLSGLVGGEVVSGGTVTITSYVMSQPAGG